MKKIFLFFTAILFFYTITLATELSNNQNLDQINNLSSFNLDFSFINSCLGDSTQFINTSTIAGDTFLAFLWKFGDGTATIIRANPKHPYQKSGTYTVWLIAITYGGHKDSIFKAISIYPKPSAPVITQNGNTLYSSAASGNQWYDSNGAIAGATAQSYLPVKKGNYWVTISFNIGCSSDASNMIFYNPALIQEDVNNNRFLVYPNPGNGLFYIRNYSSEKLMSAKMYDAMGKLVTDYKITKGINRIDLSNMPKGMYYLLIQDEKGMIMMKAEPVILIR